MGVKKNLADIALVAGLGLIVFGIWQWWTPAAFIFAGTATASLAVLWSLNNS